MQQTKSQFDVNYAMHLTSIVNVRTRGVCCLTGTYGDDGFYYKPVLLSGIAGVTYLIRTVRETMVNNMLGSKSKMSSPTCCVLT